jgi:hypothetical protein
MSAMELLPMESQPRPSSLSSFPITNANILQEKSNPNVNEKKISYEVTKNSYNRKVEVKTKQEETICTTKKPSSPCIVTRITRTETPRSPHRITVQKQRRSSSINLFK